MHYEPLTPAMLVDPYSFYNQVRAVTPVSWFDAGQCWLVLDHRNCTQVLADPAFARDPSRAGRPVPHTARSMQNIDPPELFDVRSVFMTAASRRRNRWALHQFERFIDTRLRGLSFCGSFDMVADVCVPACALMVSLLMGINVQPSSALDAAVAMVILGMDAGIEPERAADSVGAKAFIDQALAKGLFEARGSAQVTSIFARASDHHVNDSVIKNTMRVMFSSIYIAGSSALANASYWLLRDRNAYEQLHAHPDAETAAQELVRFDSAVHLVARTVISPRQLGDQQLRVGDEVVAVLGSANRDAAQFQTPDRIDLMRAPNKHLGFSAGPHSCLASGLAREMIAVFCRTLVTQRHRFWLAAPPTRLPTVTMRRIQCLPVSATITGDKAGDNCDLADSTSLNRPTTTGGLIGSQG